jgi:hypothetical protein
MIRRPSPVPAVVAPALQFAIQSPAPVFTMQDFRLFNHFIQDAYPHHPIGNDSVWKHEIPCIASNVSCPLELSQIEFEVLIVAV